MLSCEINLNINYLSNVITWNFTNIPKSWKYVGNEWAIKGGYGEEEQFTYSDLFVSSDDNANTNEINQYVNDFYENLRETGIILNYQVEIKSF